MDKVRNMTVEAARELVSNQVLWPRIRDFLWDFAPQVHPSWWPNLESRDVATSPRVKRFILDSLGVEPFFHDFPKEDGSRLALLDGSTLEAVVKWLGALACAEGIRKITDGASVRALRAALPGVYPEALGFIAYFKELVSCGVASSQSVADGVASAGCEILLSAIADLPPALVSRLKLKLPKDLCSSAPLREASRATWLPAILKLLKLKFPEAYSLCSS